MTNEPKLDVFSGKKDDFKESASENERLANVHFRNEQDKRTHERHFIAKLLGYGSEKSRSAAILLAALFSLFLAIDYSARQAYITECLGVVTLCIGYLFGNDK